MPSIAWLLVAIVAGVAAYLVGWPAWQSYRRRESRDLNADRYLAWRGRAPRRQAASVQEGMTAEERRRFAIGAVLGLVAIVGFVGFFATS